MGTSEPEASGTHNKPMGKQMTRKNNVCTTPITSCTPTPAAVTRQLNITTTYMPAMGKSMRHDGWNDAYVTVSCFGAYRRSMPRPISPSATRAKKAAIWRASSR